MRYIHTTEGEEDPDLDRGYPDSATLELSRRTDHTGGSGGDGYIAAGGSALYK